MFDEEKSMNESKIIVKNAFLKVYHQLFFKLSKIFFNFYRLEKQIQC
jgi:hypothetical protein